MSLPLFLIAFTAAPVLTMVIMWRLGAGAAPTAFAPFIWILLSPIATIWMQSNLLESIVGPEHCAFTNSPGMDAWECPRADVIPTLLPGLVNLVPLVWLIHPDSTARYAGLVSGLMGSLRFAAPLAMYQWGSGTGAKPGYVTMSNTGFWSSALDASVLVSGLLWILTLVAFVVFVVIRESRSRRPT